MRRAERKRFYLIMAAGVPDVANDLIPVALTGGAAAFNIGNAQSGHARATARVQARSTSEAFEQGLENMNVFNMDNPFC
jgi:hypothetical protein